MLRSREVFVPPAQPPGEALVVIAGAMLIVSYKEML